MDLSGHVLRGKSPQEEYQLQTLRNYCDNYHCYYPDIV
jgi:hypothetical protein